MIEITEKDWNAEGERRYGPRRRDWKFICPACHHIQSGHDFLAAGLTPEDAGGYLGFSCVGRFLPGSRAAFAEGEDGPGPCNYAGGGLFKVSPIKVVTESGEEVFMFDFADDPLETRGGETNEAACAATDRAVLHVDDTRSKGANAP